MILVVTLDRRHALIQEQISLEILQLHFGNGVCTTNLTRRSWRILSKLTFGQINMKIKMLMNLKMVLMMACDDVVSFFGIPV